MSEISRRNFLKGAAVAGAAVAGSAALAGCSSGGSAASGDWMPKSWDYETDVVVVGYGGAGMWSSLVAADEGGSEVVILEKAPVEGGGNSRINNGEWTVIKDEKLFRDYCVAFGHGLIEEDMIDAYIGEATKHTDYADKYGMTYEVAEKALAGTIPEYWFLDDGKYAGCIGVSNVEGFGMTTFHELEAKRAELGLPIEIRFKCTEEHLVQNPDTKEIVGVRFLEDGDREDHQGPQGRRAVHGRLRVQRGAQEHLPEHLSVQVRGLAVQHRRRHPHGRGSGREALAHEHGHLHHGHVDARPRLRLRHLRQPAVRRVLHGEPPGQALPERGQDGRHGAQRLAHPHVVQRHDRRLRPHPVWQIFDQKGIDGGPMGTQQGGWFECGNYTTDLPDEIRAWDGWSDDNQVEIERGWVLKGDTLEELRPEDQRLRRLDGHRHAQGDVRRVPGLLRCRQGRALRPRADGRGEQALRVRPVLRHLHLPRLLLHAGRPEEERERARCWTRPAT